MYLEEETTFFKDRLKVLEIAPALCFHDKCKTLANIDYVSGDISSPIAMVRMDITALPLPNDHFDCIICYHVLDDVVDDRQAMRELWRVLKPGGWAIVQSPIGTDGDTFEISKALPFHERERLYGEAVNNRIYGSDYKARLVAAGFNVKEDDFVKRLEPEVIRRNCLDRNEIIHLCAKPA